LECSALSQKNLPNVFEEAVKAVLAASSQTKDPKNKDQMKKEKCLLQ